MKTRSVLPLFVATLLLAALPATAQIRITGAISGTVTDADGGVIPGASVQLRDEATGATKDTVTNETGIFSFADLNFGTYRISVTLSGFRSAVYNKVVVESGRTTDLRVKLAVGGLEETITVEGATPVLETTSNMISNTLNRKTISEIPLAGRNVFTLSQLVPGATSPQGFGPKFNGMPGGVINPTIDGINNSSNGWKSGGTSFFGTVPARLGAIEEVTVETLGQGAESGAMGGVNLKFVTRRGTNQYRGSGFWQGRNEFFNANSYNNNSRGLPKNKLRRHDVGGNFGGPLLRGTRFHDKAFIFVNYEQELIPATNTRSQVLLKPETQQGVFTYQTSTGERRTANVLDIARAAGFPSTPDPIVAQLLARQQQARQYGVVSTTNSLLTEQLQWIEPQDQTNYYPTVRMDYQISPNLAWMGSWNLYRQDAPGRRQWPFPDHPKQLDTFKASWWIASTGLNWSINTNTHNEFRYGVQHSGDTTPLRAERRFFEQLNGTINGLPARFTLPFDLQTLANDGVPITGRHYITTLSDTLTMMRGNHKYTFGGTFRATNWRDTDFAGPGSGGYLGLPRYSINSLATADPASGIFSATSMPGISNNDLGNVRALYALLTGRVAQVQTGKILDPDTLQYSDQIYRENWTASNMGGVFAQDQWRMTPNFTLNYGLRYEVTGAPYSKLGNANFPDVANLYGPSTRLFAPGELNGVQVPTLSRGEYAAKTDYDNIAPNIGFAWTPMAKEGGFMSKLIGSGRDTVIRGSYSKTYYDEGTNMFAWNAGDNSGYGQSLLLQPGIGFQAGTLTLQTPLPPFVAFPTEYKEIFPQSDFTFSNDFRTMADDLKTGYVHSWNIGLQRQVAPGTVVEARYVGTRGENVWRTYNINEVNIFENGFLAQFRAAQNNLAISVAADGTRNFSNRGLPGQVSIPIFETAFGARGSRPALPSGSGYTNGTFLTNLEQGTAGTLANSLAGGADYVCRLFGSDFTPCVRLGYDAPGSYPINLFLANPYAGTQGAFLVDDTGITRYHALQLQLRQRYAHGLQMSFNYTLGKSEADMWSDSPIQDVNYRTLRNQSLDFGEAFHDIRHTINAFGTYDLPFGRDRRWGVDNALVDAALGGWTVGWTISAFSGTPFRLVSNRGTFNQFDSGVILVNGTTVEELQNAIGIFPGPGFSRYWIDPKYIGADGRMNPDYVRAPTEPGELGERVTLRGKARWNFDASVNKDFDFPGRMNMRLHITVTNVLNHPIWNAPNALDFPNITSTTFGQTGNPRNGARQMYLRTEFTF